MHNKPANLNQIKEFVRFVIDTIYWINQKVLSNFRINFYRKIQKNFLINNNIYRYLEVNFIKTIVIEIIVISEKIRRRKCYRIAQKNAILVSEFASATLRECSFLCHPASANQKFDRSTVNTIIVDFSNIYNLRNFLIPAV
jgi:hypothetical protein